MPSSQAIICLQQIIDNIPTIENEVRTLTQILKEKRMRKEKKKTKNK